MKIAVYDDAPKEKVVRLTLLEENGIVYVAAVDEYGKAISYLLSITQEGITRCRLVNERLGFPLLTVNGRIKMAEEETVDTLPLREQVANIAPLLGYALTREYKIHLIKIVCHLTEMGLERAKDYVEKEFDM